MNPFRTLKQKFCRDLAFLCSEAHGGPCLLLIETKNKWILRNMNYHPGLAKGNPGLAVPLLCNMVLSSLRKNGLQMLSVQTYRSCDRCPVFAVNALNVAWFGILNISETANLLGFSCIPISRVYRGLSEKETRVLWTKICCCCQRKMGRLVWDDRTVKVTQRTEIM